MLSWGQSKLQHLQKVFMLISCTRRHSPLTLLWKSSPSCQVSFCSSSDIPSRAPLLHVCTKFALPFLFRSPSILLRSIHLLLCQSTCLSAAAHLSVCLSSLQSLCGNVFVSSTACSACQLQSIQHGGQLRRPNLPWQSAETARPSKMWSLCGQDNVDLTCPLCNHCGSVAVQEISVVFRLCLFVCCLFSRERQPAVGNKAVTGDLFHYHTYIRSFFGSLIVV